MGFDPDLVILHTGTNSLRGENTPKKIAEDIITLATELRRELRRDQLREKAEEANDFLCQKTLELGISFISHRNINTDTDLKTKGLHLNQEGLYFIGWQID